MKGRESNFSCFGGGYVKIYSYLCNQYQIQYYYVIIYYR